mgnify:CR=1 FL=1
MKFIQPNMYQYINGVIHVIGVTSILTTIVVGYKFIMWILYV